MNDTVIPARAYGGTERVIWWLGRALVRMGHTVTYLVAAGSTCEFARVMRYRPELPLGEQIPTDVDVVHLHHRPTELDPTAEFTDKPWLRTVHGNGQPGERYPQNAVFVSRNHAERHGAKAFVHNGLDPADYGTVVWSVPRNYYLFLGKASWKVKNLAGAKRIARRAGHPLAVLGGTGVDLLGRVTYLGMVGGTKKNLWLNRGRALLFPVRWHEPFGLAVIEAMYFGCPVVGTPYGAVPELVTPEVGHLASSYAELIAAAQKLERWDRRAVQAHVLRHFTAERMARDYVALYERVIAGERLNTTQPRAADDDPGLLTIAD